MPWAHVDADKGKITIRAYGTWKPKTASSARTAYPSDELMEELLRLPTNGDYVFPGRDVQNVRTALATAAKKARLTRNGRPMPVTVKLFRKAFATRLARTGANHSVVGALMGHAPGSKMTDQRYKFITDEDKRQSRLSLREVTQVGIA